MTRLGRRATLLVAFSLLTSAATAYAECAWVLWEQINVQPYEAKSAWPDKASCSKEQRRFLDTQFYSLVSKGEDSVTVDAGEPKQRLVITVRCFPDTVDPRGPKGK
jgi:hypothetical protein